MSIRFSCPNCEKDLKVKDELAGQRVKCPGCNQGILVPAMSPAAVVDIDPETLFLRAVENSDCAEIARLLDCLYMTLIEDAEDSDGDHRAALVAEIDDRPVLVAFTSDKYVRAFGEAMPDMLDATGNLRTFLVDGPQFFQKLEPEFGVLLNAEHDDSMLIPPEMVSEIQAALSELGHESSEFDGEQNEQARQIREAAFAYLNERGFRFAQSLPLADVHRQVRPADEIAARLMSLAVVFSWVTAPSEAAPSEKIKDYIKRNRLRRWLTDEEVKILTTNRAEARQEHSNSIGWKLENMWPLAWILGLPSEPTIEASQIDNDVSRAILLDMLAGLEKDLDELVRTSAVRSSDEVLALEDRFYCAHNAVRSAQLGEETVPEDFHPVAHGGAVHERRHSLTWSLSGDTSWDETDLST